MEKRALIAIVLSVLILILYQEWVGRFYGPPEQTESPEKIPSPQKPRPVIQERSQKSSKAVSLPAESQRVEQNVKELRIETDLYIATFTSRGARLKSLLLKQYRTSVEQYSPPFEMVISQPGVPYPLGIQLRGGSPF